MLKRKLVILGWIGFLLSTGAPVQATDLSKDVNREHQLKLLSQKARGNLDYWLKLEANLEKGFSLRLLTALSHHSEEVQIWIDHRRQALDYSTWLKDHSVIGFTEEPSENFDKKFENKPWSKLHSSRMKSLLNLRHQRYLKRNELQEDGTFKQITTTTLLRLLELLYCYDESGLVINLERMEQRAYVQNFFIHLVNTNQMESWFEDTFFSFDILWSKSAQLSIQFQQMYRIEAYYMMSMISRTMKALQDSGHMPIAAVLRGALYKTYYRAMKMPLMSFMEELGFDALELHKVFTDETIYRAILGDAEYVSLFLPPQAKPNFQSRSLLGLETKVLFTYGLRQLAIFNNNDKELLDLVNPVFEESKEQFETEYFQKNNRFRVLRQLMDLPDQNSIFFNFTNHYYPLTWMHAYLNQTAFFEGNLRKNLLQDLDGSLSKEDRLSLSEFNLLRSEDPMMMATLVHMDPIFHLADETNESMSQRARVLFINLGQSIGVLFPFVSTQNMPGIQALKSAGYDMDLRTQHFYDLDFKKIDGLPVHLSPSSAGGYSSLYFALPNEDFFFKLVELGASMEMQTPDGYNLFHFIAERSHRMVQDMKFAFELFLDRVWSQLQKSERSGGTRASHLLTQEAHSIIEIQRENEDPILLKNPTPLDLALAYQNPNLTQWLEQKIQKGKLEVQPVQAKKKKKKKKKKKNLTLEQQELKSESVPESQTLESQETERLKTESVSGKSSPNQPESEVRDLSRLDRIFPIQTDLVAQTNSIQAEEKSEDQEKTPSPPQLKTPVSAQPSLFSKGSVQSDDEIVISISESTVSVSSDVESEEVEFPLSLAGNSQQQWTLKPKWAYGPMGQKRKSLRPYRSQFAIFYQAQFPALKKSLKKPPESLDVSLRYALERENPDSREILSLLHQLKKESGEQMTQRLAGLGPKLKDLVLLLFELNSAEFLKDAVRAVLMEGGESAQSGLLSPGERTGMSHFSLWEGVYVLNTLFQLGIWDLALEWLGVLSSFDCIQELPEAQALALDRLGGYLGFFQNHLTLAGNALEPSLLKPNVVDVDYWTFETLRPGWIKLQKEFPSIQETIQPFLSPASEDLFTFQNGRVYQLLGILQNYFWLD